MDFAKSLMIMKPFQLPWKFVSPANYRGLDYHLSPDLTIRLERIVNNTVRVDENGLPLRAAEDAELLVGQEIFLSYEDGHFGDLSSLGAERIFKNEILSLKNQERIDKCFSKQSDNISCFLTESQMAHFHQLFESYIFVCHEVSVRYKGSLIDDIAELPPKEFKLAADAFAELNVVQATVDYSESKQELNDAYHEYLEKKVASRELDDQDSLWDRMKKPGRKKAAAKTIGSLIAGAACWGIKRKLLASKSWIGIVAGTVLSVVGVVCELYGKQTAESLMFKQQFGN